MQSIFCVSGNSDSKINKKLQELEEFGYTINDVVSIENVNDFEILCLKYDVLKSEPIYNTVVNGLMEGTKFKLGECQLEANKDEQLQHSDDGGK